jgi:hypothetical protein
MNIPWCTGTGQKSFNTSTASPSMKIARVVQPSPPTERCIEPWIRAKTSKSVIIRGKLCCQPLSRVTWDIGKQFHYRYSRVVCILNSTTLWVIIPVILQWQVCGVFRDSTRHKPCPKWWKRFGNGLTRVHHEERHCWIAKNDRSQLEVLKTDRWVGERQRAWKHKQRLPVGVTVGGICNDSHSNTHITSFIHVSNVVKLLWLWSRY